MKIFALFVEGDIYRQGFSHNAKYALYRTLARAQLARDTLKKKYDDVYIMELVPEEVE